MEEGGWRGFFGLIWLFVNFVETPRLGEVGSITFLGEALKPLKNSDFMDPVEQELIEFSGFGKKKRKIGEKSIFPVPISVN